MEGNCRNTTPPLNGIIESVGDFPILPSKKTAIITINAKYVHIPLAAWYLNEAVLTYENMNAKTYCEHENATIGDDHNSTATISNDHNSTATISDDHNSTATISNDHNSTATISNDHNSTATRGDEQDKAARSDGGRNKAVRKNYRRCDAADKGLHSDERGVGDTGVHGDERCDAADKGLHSDERGVGDKGVRGDERCDAADKGVHGDERGVGDTGVHGDERGVGVGDGCSVLEFTINDRYDAVLAAIVHENADILAFSCYIWNIGVVLRLIVDLKSIDNRYVIILGGPEISFSAREILAENSGVDFIISGEGENVLPVLISAVKTGQKDFRGIESVSFRDRRTNEIVISDRFNLVEDLDTIPTPFRQAGYGALHCVRSRIVYYEASRGCPYSCSYCMSSAFEGVRFFSFERVKNDLRTIVESGARLVKFVDRTFNCDKKRVVQVLRFIKQFRGTTFHFEMVPELFDSEMIDEIAGFEKGGLQFEIGVQSTNSAALESVSRRFNRVEAFDNITRLLALGNVHIHLGLIAGLPYETFESFAQTFDTVHRLRAHQMQCGFLKLLRGSAIRKNAGMYGFAYQYQAPYEILKNNFISYQDLCIIKSVERMLDSLYNSAAFKFSLIYATEIIFDSPFAFYRAVSSYAEDRGIDALTNIGRREYYSILSSFCLDEFPSHAGIFKILLLLDFYCSGIRADVPANIYERHDFKAHEFLRKLTLRGVDFPSGLAGKKISEISKKAKFALMPVRLELAALESGRFTEYVLKKREELRLMGEQAIDCKWAYLFDLTAKDPVTGRHSFYSYPFEK